MVTCRLRWDPGACCSWRFARRYGSLLTVRSGRARSLLLVALRAGRPRRRRRQGHGDSTGGGERRRGRGGCPASAPQVGPLRERGYSQEAHAGEARGRSGIGCSPMSTVWGRGMGREARQGGSSLPIPGSLWLWPLLIHLVMIHSRLSGGSARETPSRTQRFPWNSVAAAESRASS